MSTLPKHHINALKYYSGQADAYPLMPNDNKAYNTLNTLLYNDTVSERARVKEGKRLNPDFFDEAPSSALPKLCADLITSAVLGGKGSPEQVVYRVSRYSDVEAMKLAGKTLTFTSTSKNGFLKTYTDKCGLVLLEFKIPANAPRADFGALVPDYSKPEEAEVLLPPWLPVEFEMCELSTEELQITDREGKPPVSKFLVQVGDELEPPELSYDCPSEMPDSDPGKRVLNALLSGKEPDPADEKKYLNWKKALLAEIVTESSFQRMNEIFAYSLNAVQYITEYVLDDPLDASKGRAWIKSLLGIDDNIGFSKRIDELPDERASHTITTFLFGNWLRDKLHLDFIKLPRIFSKNNKVGDSFPFFWAIVCLGHDIGYVFENNNPPELIQSLIDDTTTDYQNLRSLLKLRSRKTLLELTRTDLMNYGLTDLECDWAEKSIHMVHAYYRYRLKNHCRIDHGVAGGIVLFDAMLEMAPKNSFVTPLSRHQGPSGTGFVAANSWHSRFIACGILISLTVARHNMWVADINKPNDNNTNPVELYWDADLNELIVDGDKNKLSIHEPLDQLLYFLDYLDTIDPFKAFYLRNIKDSSNRNAWQEFVTQRIRIGFCRSEIGGSHRISFRFDIIGFAPNPKPSIESFSSSVGSMIDWLQMKEGSLVAIDSINVYLPATKQRSCINYGYAVTEAEILDILFYQGVSDSSRPGSFYQSRSAYQSLNLFMMGGLTGERIRIGKEFQRPNSIYIRNWKRTLTVFKNIFSAMCKCRDAFSDEDNILHRMDRRINAEQMCYMKRTIAFTSATKAEILPKFLKSKHQPVIETLRLTEQIPNFDFQQVLKDDYVYIDEVEVLLPPFVLINNPPELPLKTVSDSENKSPICLDLTMGNIDFPLEHVDKANLIQKLDLLKDKAAETLDYFVANHTALLDVEKENDYSLYVEWKKAFQELVSIEFCKIYSEITSTDRGK